MNIQQTRSELLAQIEADHAEGEAIVAAINNDIAVGIAHAEALVMNSAHTLAKQTGFTVEACAAELKAEEGDYFAVLARLRSVVDDAQAEALELNELRDFRIDAPEPAQVARTASITDRIVEKQNQLHLSGRTGVGAFFDMITSHQAVKPRKLRSHIIAPVFILLMLLIGGSFNADAAEPVEHWVCGGQQVSYDGKSLTVDGWRFTRPLEVVKKQPSVTRAVGFENTNRQIVMLITVEGTTIFAGDYYPEVACTK